MTKNEMLKNFLIHLTGTAPCLHSQQLHSKKVKYGRPAPGAGRAMVRMTDRRVSDQLWWKRHSFREAVSKGPFHFQSLPPSPSRFTILLPAFQGERKFQQEGRDLLS